MEQELRKILESVEGEVGLSVLDIDGGVLFQHNADIPFPMASVCKVPILATAYASDIPLTERIEFTDSAKCLGSGLFSAFSAGINPTLYDLLLMMIVVSDNAATDIVLNRVGMPAVNKLTSSFGLSSIRIDRTIKELINDCIKEIDPAFDQAGTATYRELLEHNPGLKAKADDQNLSREAVNRATVGRDESSPNDMAKLFLKIATGDGFSETATKAMKDIFECQLLNARLPRYLPQGTKCWHKTGTLGQGAVVNDSGVLVVKDVPIALVSFFSRNVKSPQLITERAIGNIALKVTETLTSG